MSNSLPVTAFSAAPTPAPASLSPAPLVETPSRPQLTVVPSMPATSAAPVVAREKAPADQPAPVTPAPAVAPGEPPELPELLRIYREQKRECWMCKKIAGTIDAGKEPSEDDRWHFTTCVLSWEGL